MGKLNDEYWYEQWHNDHQLHFKLGVKNITPIKDSEHVSIYSDTDSLFVSFKPAIDHCDWKNLLFNGDYMKSLDKKLIILSNDFTTNSKNCVGVAKNINDLEELIKNEYELLIFDGNFIKDRRLNTMIQWCFLK